MFTLQAPNMSGALQQAGMSAGMQEALLPLGNCAQTLQHRGQININGQMPGPYYATQPGNTPPGVPMAQGAATNGIFNINGTSFGVGLNGRNGLNGLNGLGMLQMNGNINLGNNAIIGPNGQVYLPYTENVVTDVSWDATNHRLVQTKIPIVFLGTAGAPNPTTIINASAVNVITDVQWNSPALQKQFTNSVYVFTPGAVQALANINVAGPC
jgi:hypothetical protein